MSQNQTITLDTPIKRGDQVITELTLRKPSSGELRGIEFSAQLQDATRSTEKDMMGLMDVIQRTYYTGVNPDWMLQGFSKLSAGMDTVKMKGLEGAKALAPLLAMANQAGMTDGGSAGNAYRKVFQKSMDSGKIDKTLAELNKKEGLNIKMNFTDGKGEFGGLPQMFKELDKLKGLSTETRSGFTTQLDLELKIDTD